MWNASGGVLQLYSPPPARELIATWPVPGSTTFNTSGALFADNAGNSYIRTRVGDPPEGDNMALTGRMFGITGLVRYPPGGAPLDSIPAPELMLDSPRLVASVEGNTTMNDVPWSPRFIWAFSPQGAFVSARTDQYSITIAPFDASPRITTLRAEQVTVSAAERNEAETITTLNMRTTDPNWSWNGAPIPSVKPYIKSLNVDRDGRIWVSISQPGEMIPENERGEPRITNGIEIPAWTIRERTVYDLFSPTGEFLGRIPFPPATQWRAATGSHIWTITRDSLDVPQVTRFRVTFKQE